jgi:hypothetical protein
MIKCQQQIMEGLVGLPGFDRCPSQREEGREPDFAVFVGNLRTMDVGCGEVVVVVMRRLGRYFI